MYTTLVPNSTATPTAYVTMLRNINGDVYFAGFEGDVPDWREDDCDPEVLLWERYDPESDDDKEQAEEVESYIRRLMNYGHSCEAVTVLN